MGTRMGTRLVVGRRLFEMASRAAAALKTLLKLRIPAGGASASPPTGPALGQAGVNIMEFCKEFNARTGNLNKDTPVPVVVRVFEDRTFEFATSAPPTSFFLKKAAKIEKGAAKPGHEVAGEVSLKQVYEIAKMKHNDPRQSLESLCRSIVGSARSMGIKVIRK